MAVLIPVNHAEVTVRWKHASLAREWATVFGITYEALSTYEEVHANVRSCIQNYLFTRMDISITWVATRYRHGPSTGSSPGPTIEVAEGGTGALTIEGIPANGAVLVRKNTNLGGRSNRGRMFLPGMLADTDVNEVGVIGSSPLAAIQSDIDDFLLYLQTGDDPGLLPTPMVILHDEAAPTTEPTIVASLAVQNVIGSQRRRIRP